MNISIAINTITRGLMAAGINGNSRAGIPTPSFDADFALSETLDPRITFSRASNATRVNSAGLIEYAPHNLLTFSEQFDNAAWVKTRTSITSNVTATTAPNETNTADKLVEDTSATTSHIVDSTAFSGQLSITYVASFYLKAAERTKARVVLLFGGSNGAYADADLSAGTIGAATAFNTATAGTSSITSVGNGWYRCTVSGSSSASASINTRVELLDASGNRSYTGDGTSGLYIWGAQLNVGALQPYYPTTVKNLLGFSESFENAAWTKSNSFIQTNLAPWSEDATQWGAGSNMGTTLANQTTAPDGNQTADKIVENTANATHFLSQTQTTSYTSGTAYTRTIFLKEAGRIYASVYFPGTNFPASGRTAVFDLQTGTIVSTESGVTSSIESYGNGWYRCRITATATSTGTGHVGGSSISDNASMLAYTGDGTSGVFVWGAQLVQGSTAGDYQQTLSAATPVMYKAPNGTMTADKLVENTANAVHFTQLITTCVSGTPFIASMYAKAGERSKLEILDPYTLTGRTFNLSNGTTEAVQTGGVTNATVNGIQNIGNGWYRCYIGVTTTGTNIALRATVSNGSTTLYTGNGSNGVYLWGAQLSDSASLDTYVATPGAAPTSTAYYGPRFDYDPVTLAPKGLLIEEQRTNLVLQSANLAISPWGTGGSSSTITANDGVAPDGTQTAAKLDSAVNSGRFSSPWSTTSGTTYTTSIYVKAISGGPNLQLVVAGSQPFGGTGGDRTVVFNAFTGAFVSKSADVSTYSITSVGNGWWRVTGSFTATANATTAMAIYAGASPTVFYAWGAQLEAGAFATSYIPTTTAAATRSADIATVTGSNFASWYNTDEGTLFVEYAKGDNNSGRRAVTINNGTSMNQIRVSVSVATLTRPDWQIINGGSVEANVLGPDVAINAFAKVAGCYQVNNIQAAVNGTLRTADTSAVIPTVNQMAIGANEASGSLLNGTIKRISYTPRRLSNQQLQNLTL